jgi:hypothetical protein
MIEANLMFTPKLKAIAFILVIMLATAGLGAAQCTTVYNNIASDGVGNVHAWTVLTDNYTNLGSGCAPPLWVIYGFRHTYSTTVTITSPSHRVATNTGTGSQLGGSGTGSVRTDDYLPIGGETGPFLLSGSDSITCTAAGLFYSLGLAGTYTQPPVLNSVQVNGQPTATILAGSTGYLLLNGQYLLGLTSVLINGTGVRVTGIQFSNDTQIKASYQADATAQTGSDLVTVATVHGTSNPVPAFVTKLTLRSVGFTNNLTISQDYNGGLLPIANPVWYVTNQPSANGPVAYVQGKTMAAQAEFAMNHVPVTAIPGVRVEGDIPGLGKFIATGVTIPASSSVTVAMNANTALPAVTKVYTPMTVNWYVSQQGTACTSPSYLDCALAGSSANTVYVTLGTPTVNPIAQTYLYLGVAGGGATTPSQAFAYTWAKFSGPANVTTWDGRALSYYQQGVGFNGCATDALNLIEWKTGGSGQCGAFARLLMAALNVNGISSSFTTVKPLDSQTVMVVRDWTLGTPSHPDSAPYQYLLPLKVETSGLGMVPLPSPPVFGDLTSLSEIPGQNTSPPSEKVFGAHFIVKIDPAIAPPGQGPYFDPSYGVWYAGASDFEANAILGYAKFFSGDPVNTLRLRKKGGGVNISLVP